MIIPNLKLIRKKNDIYISSDGKSRGQSKEIKTGQLSLAKFKVVGIGA